MPTIIQPIRNLQNGTRINGVEHIYQAAKPTTRVDGSPLAVRDRWYNTGDGRAYFWNGVYWLSETLFNVQGRLTASVSDSYAGSLGPAIVFSDYNNIFVERAQVRWFYTGYTANDYWQLQVNIDIGTNVLPAALFLMPTYNTNSGDGVYELAVNTFFNVTKYPFGIRMWQVKVGSPGNITYAEGYRYRLAIP